MDRTTVTKIIAALAAAAALVALGALLPKPDPVPLNASVGGQASLAPDSINPVLGQASLAPDSTNPVVGQASLAPSASYSSPLHVYVCGAVHKPGVYELPSGTRVVDAIAQAGGAVENGDLEQLNLAELLTDSMKVDVPLKGRQLSSATGSRGGAPPGSSSSAGSGRSGRHHSTRGGSHKLSAGQTIDINTASESELVQLPGVGPSLARRIVEYRAANGPFQIPDDLQNVSGIGPTKYAKMEPFVRV